MPIYHRCPITVALIIALATLTGCETHSTGTVADPVPEVPPAKLGEACVAAADCRLGLGCVDEVCSLMGDKEPGSSCQLTGECRSGNFCDARPSEDEGGLMTSDTGVCRPGGANALGGPCGTAADCVAGLICIPRGLSGVCAEGGSVDIGAPCEDVTDCAAGLGCVTAPGAPMAVCTAGPMGQPVPFPGVACDTDDDGPLRIYFDLDGTLTGDFFRLPYPNDARLQDGRPRLAGFPTPGDDLLGFDIVDRYLRAVEEGQQGFGLKPTVYFRFSGRFDFNSVDARGEAPNLRFIDITPDSPTYDSQPALSWQFSTAAGRYICPNWLAVTTSWGRPLRANTTYAVILSEGIVDPDGQQVSRDEDFALMMSATRPSGTAGAAWDAYQPLRDWAAREDTLSPDQILGATVFTTGDPRTLVEELRAPARQTPPTSSGLVACDDGVESPCAPGCSDGHDAFVELQGTLDLPIFQSGTAPYLDSGGAIARSAGGPTVQRREEICAAITVPKTEMPEAGWPLLIYAHGTGGDYRTHVSQISPLVSAIDIDGEETAMVVIGWDQVQHASRQGDRDADGQWANPEPLVYNYANPAGARGNFLQSAADIFAIVAWAETFELVAEDSPTGQALRIDPEHIYVMGHSQGGTSAPLALPFEPKIRAALLSGAGAGLAYSLLEKTSPSDARLGLAIAIQDPTVNTPNHPVLSLIQGYFDAVDPHTYAPFIAASELEDRTHRSHVFHAYGLGDTYTPPSTLDVMARALGVAYLPPILDEISGVNPADPPVGGNRNGFTALGRQYQPEDYDGHFVLPRHPQAREDLRQFFGSAIVNAPEAPVLPD